MAAGQQQQMLMEHFSCDSKVVFNVINPQRIGGKCQSLDFENRSLNPMLVKIKSGKVVSLSTLGAVFFHKLAFTTKNQLETLIRGDLKSNIYLCNNEVLLLLSIQ